jgi:VCBS repeat-containing protein
VADTSAVDTSFADVTGTLTAADTKDTPTTTGFTFKLTGSSTTRDATISGEGFTLSKAGTYGTLYMKTSGEYKYVANAAVVDALTAADTDKKDEFTVVASMRGVDSEAGTLTINVTGEDEVTS